MFGEKIRLKCKKSQSQQSCGDFQTIERFFTPKNGSQQSCGVVYPFLLNKKLFLIIITLLVFASYSYLIFAPPTPHSVNGYILFSNGSQVPLNTSYRVNVSNGDVTNYFKQSKTSFPLQNYSGYYSESVSGNDGDNLTVTSWNKSSYGFTSVTLIGTMNGVNVTLNLSRDPEPTVNITNIQNNAVRNGSILFNITSNLTLFGNSANNCNAEISFSNTSILSMYGGTSSLISLGSLSLGYSTIYRWNITGIGVGSSDVTINFTCDNMFGTKFEDLNYTQTIYNITILDSTGPNITLIYPLNNTKTMNSSIIFSYNVTDFSNVTSCSLYINNTFKQTNNTITKYTTLFFNETINEGINIWQVRCNDTYDNVGLSRNVTIIKDTNVRTLYTEYTSYIQGLTARILGYNWTNSSNITLTLTRSNGSTINRTLIATNGIINTTFFINYSDPLGDYNLSAYETNYTFYNATNNFTINQRIQNLTIDKNEYLTNENISITGFNFTINGTVNLRFFWNLTNSTGYQKNVTSNNSGNFFTTYNVTTLCTGVYGITAKDLNYSSYQETIYFNVSGGASCVNWGNTAPNITAIVVDDQFTSPQNEINLLAGVNTEVFCNFTVFDAQGISDINTTNATFYYYLNKSSDPDNNNVHYSNNNCTETGNNGVDTKYFSCGFNISYYTNNGTWICNATVVDYQNAKGYANDSTKILDLYAVNMTSLVDYGDVPTGNISNEIPLLISNLGNMMIDVNLSAYGVTQNDGIALNCTTNNISLVDEKYTLTSLTPFASMTALTSNPIQLSTFNLVKQTSITSSQKNIYFRVKPTPLSYGDCQGIIVVTAVTG